MSNFLNPELLIYVFSLSLGIVVIGCLLPAHWLPPLPNDKFLHFLAYAWLSLIIVSFIKDFKDLLLWQFGLLVIGIAIEGIQHFIPGRQFCWRDILANSAGIVTVGIGSLICYL
ncbi:VanZ family protein [Undibacterium danionis]|uniref:VanZ family protein n=1 Tax=Undibacterium danionis TaxID=1812100 RepID=A0ABV6IH63_9BURK